MNERKIIHIDMDAFYASVEQRDNAFLRDKPIAVGHDAARGVIATASYEARRYGVHSALSVKEAKRRCPKLIVVPPDFDKYKRVSQQVHEIFHDYTDVIEPLSLDEAFLDVTQNKRGMVYAVDIAREIRGRINRELHLTASAGVSYNKFLAKIASDYRKPDGLYVVHPDKAIKFIHALKIEDFWGVGAKTASKFHKIGVHNGAQLSRLSRQRLTELFGKQGEIYYDFSHGIDLRPVVSDYFRKSVGCEHTFEKDIFSKTAVMVELYHVVLELLERLQKSGFKGKTLTLKIKYEDFSQITRSITYTDVLNTKAVILEKAKQLLKQIEFSSSHRIRLMGVAVSNPITSDETKLTWTEGFLEFKEEVITANH